MRAYKILGLVVGGFVALTALLLGSLWLFVNPNHYTPQIVAAIKQATGRELSVPGDVTLTVFPWVALQVGPAGLGNPRGFGDQPFLSFQHAAILARLLPLLAERLEIGRVENDGLNARLLRNADGRGNWEGLGRPGDRAPAATADNAGAGPAFAGIAGIKITNSRVSCDEYRIENLNIDTGAVATRELAPVTVTFDANRGVATEHASVDARFDLSADMAARVYQIVVLTFHGTVHLANNPRPVRWNFLTPALELNLEAQTLRAPAFTSDLAGAQLIGSLQGNTLTQALDLSGQLSLVPLVVREFLPRLGMTAPRTRDPKALSLVAAAFGYGGHGARLTDMQITVDDTHVTGSAAIVDLKTRALTFGLGLDSIDLDRYLPLAGAAPDASAPASSGDLKEKTTPIDAQGTLTMGSVHLTPLDLTAVAVTVTASGGVVHLFPLQAQVDGGRYAGDIVLDPRDSVPVLTLDEHLTGIEVGKLMNSSAKGVHVSGRGTVSLQATGRGADAAALLNTLNGHLDAAVANGAVEGVDAGFQLGRAEALLRRQDATAVHDTKRTPFEILKLSADIVDGVAWTHDLTFDSPVRKVTGQGSVNLPTQAIDLKLLADTLRMAGDTPIQIPLKVTGSTADPVVRPDLDALVKGQLRQKLQDVLRDKLTGLFNR